MGLGDETLKALRQELLTATVENRLKTQWLRRTYNDDPYYRKTREAVERQDALQEALETLKAKRKTLSNPHVIRLLEGYFEEMAVVVGQLARVTRPGGKLVMVNDNVRYEGVEIAVDLILSDIAEQCGWRCDSIETLPRGKGNSSQQMAKYGRKEMRKCIYRWTRKANGEHGLHGSGRSRYRVRRLHGEARRGAQIAQGADPDRRQGNTVAGTMAGSPPV